MKDTDGDGRADLRQVEWTGFGTGSQQLRANSLHWGVDNWIYVANGRCNGDVRRPNVPPEHAISIRARDFRFHPMSGEGEAILGQSQFGLAHDAWGNRFLSWNTIPIRHVLLEETEARNFPAAATEAVINVAEPSDTGRVYPISARPRQFNTESAQYYNAMCGLTVFTGDALGTSYAGNAFIGESLTNLVTRRQLQRAGQTFVSRRSDNEKNCEFLASTDNWFHPVNLTAGPDGALYIVDFYREFVEHPLYVADEKLRAEVPWRNGAEHGRIWRIRRADSCSQPCERRPQLSRAPSAELVQLLGHPVAWWRNTAQRLLVERQDPMVVSQLRKLLAESSLPLARLHAMYTLDGLDANGTARQPRAHPVDDNVRSLENACLRHALSDPEPNIRRCALRLVAERIRKVTDVEKLSAPADRSADGAAVTSLLQNDLLQMAGDSDSGVRFQLALALGRCSDPRAYSTLASLLDKEDTPSLRLAILCGIGKNPLPLMRELMKDESRAKLHANFLEQVSEQFGLHASEKGLAEYFAWITADTARSRNPGGLATLAGLTCGLLARGDSLRDSSSAVRQPTARVAERLRKIVHHAAAIAEDANYSADDRTRAATIAANGEPADVERLVRELVRPSQPQALQSAAVQAAALANSPCAWKTLFLQWAGHTTSTRQVMLTESLRSSAGIDALVRALESNILSAQELPASTRDVLGQLPDKSLRHRVEPILASVIPANRTEVLARYASVVGRSGDAARGASIFRENCQTCHAMQGVGPKVGPDLASVTSRRTEQLIVDILDPSQQVSPDYVNYLAVTKDGRVLNGVIAGETAESVTLRREEGQQDTIPRNNIEELRASGKSIMPDGLEEKLTPDQLADLLEFLHHPDVNQLN